MWKTALKITVDRCKWSLSVSISTLVNISHVIKGLSKGCFCVHILFMLTGGAFSMLIVTLLKNKSEGSYQMTSPNDFLYQSDQFHQTKVELASSHNRNVSDMLKVSIKRTSENLAPSPQVSTFGHFFTNHFLMIYCSVFLYISAFGKSQFLSQFLINLSF